MVEKTNLNPSEVGDIVVGTVLAPGSERAIECRMAAFYAGFPGMFCDCVCAHNMEVNLLTFHVLFTMKFGHITRTHSKNCDADKLMLKGEESFSLNPKIDGAVSFVFIVYGSYINYFYILDT